MQFVLILEMLCKNVRSMSGVHLTRYGHQRTHSKGHSKDFTVATPEEFVKRFGGDRFINKVQIVRMWGSSNANFTAVTFNGCWCLLGIDEIRSN